MNQIHKLNLPYWRNLSRFSLPLAVLLLASPGLLGAETLTTPQPVEILDNRTVARLLLHVVQPDYPAVAKVNLIQGSVKLHITVNSEGKVIAAHVVAGQPLLAAAAIRAVRKWLYRPYRTAKGTAGFRAIVAVKFLLHSRHFGRRFPRDPDGFLEKQIRPPEVVTGPHLIPSSASVRFRVLVDSKGKVLDAIALGPTGAEVEPARQKLEHWRFRPARWGALAVPWYIIVRVPYKSALTSEAAYSEKR